MGNHSSQAVVDITIKKNQEYISEMNRIKVNILLINNIQKENKKLFRNILGIIFHIYRWNDGFKCNIK